MHEQPDRPRGRRPGTRIVEEVDHGTRQIDGVDVAIVETIWNGGGRSFDVYIDGAGDVLLTEDESLDAMPSDDQIACLLDAHGIRPEPLWTCPGCGHQIAESQADLITDHVLIHCDKVDGSGAPVRPDGAA
jgi:hypothetical protein